MVFLSLVGSTPRPAPVFFPEALDPKQAGEALRSAAKRGDEAEVRRLIADEGAPVDAKDNNGFTPLHCAAAHAELNVNSAAACSLQPATCNA